MILINTFIDWQKRNKHTIKNPILAVFNSLFLIAASFPLLKGSQLEFSSNLMRILSTIRKMAGRKTPIKLMRLLKTFLCRGLAPKSVCFTQYTSSPASLVHTSVQNHSQDGRLKKVEMKRLETMRPGTRCGSLKRRNCFDIARYLSRAMERV